MRLAVLSPTDSPPGSRGDMLPSSAPTLNARPAPVSREGAPAALAMIEHKGPNSAVPVRAGLVPGRSTSNFSHRFDGRR